MLIHSISSCKVNKSPHFKGSFIVEGTPDEIRKVDEMAIDEFYKEIETPLDRFTKDPKRRFLDFERINLIQQDNPISQRLYMTNDDAHILRVFKERFSLYHLFGLSVDSKSPIEELFETFFKEGNTNYYLQLMLNKHISKNPKYLSEHKRTAKEILNELKEAAFNGFDIKIKPDEIPVIQAKEILNSGKDIVFDFVKGIFKII